ncbi:unnamed protein product [Bemisia tabaci]|uniref:Leucine-rich repeat-containing protein 40 n=1 Tax=Bemisia tabaci TaxID=7038 RepID=A0A9P0AIF2_BEMTA|nr:unnamed protein product [Bemisia tabaci]
MANRKASGIPQLKRLRSLSRQRVKANESSLIISGSPNSIFNYQHPSDDDKVLTTDVIMKAKDTGVLQLSEKGLVSAVPVVTFLTKQNEPERGRKVDFDDVESKKWWEEACLTTIDLSYNHITEIPSQLSVVHSLTHLNLQHNSLKALPDQLSYLHNLNELNLNHNHFKQIPMAVYSLPKLKVLSMTNNELVKVDYEIGDVVTLTFLDLSYNKIDSIPISMCQLVSLTCLNLESNLIRELPLELKFLTALEVFKAGKNLVAELPTFEFMSSIHMIDAARNQISSFPCLKMCHRLKELILSHNNIMVITAENIENLSSVSIMDLSNNNLAKLPDELGYLSSLTNLNVSSNSLVELPSTLCKLSNLKVLLVKSNPLDIRQDIINGGTNRVLQYLATKFMERQTSPPVSNTSPYSSEKNTRLPDKYTLRKRRALHLSGYSLTCVPESVLTDAEEAEVQLVDLSNNLLTDIPAEMGKLAKNLQELNLSKNTISSLSENIKPFINLWFLDLSCNRLSRLPEEFSELQHLKEVDLSFNLFTEMPSPLFNCTHIERISFENNKISKFNVKGLSQLTQLAVLNLTNNDLQQIPPEVGNLTQLIDLQLAGNGIRHPRREILETDTRTLLSWLRSRIP